MAEQATIPAVRRPIEGGSDPVSLTGGLLNIIERAASDPNIDVDKLDRLLAMQERVVAREAEQAWIAAMKAAQEECEPIKRNKKNATTSSTYADLEKLSNEVDPIAHKHGFILSFGSGESNLKDHYRVTCDVSHVLGHTQHRYLDVPTDMTGIKGNQNKTATHGMGSAITYGRRYLKLLIFDIATTDDDGNAAGRGKTINETQEGDLEALLQEVGADRARFCRYMKVGDLGEIRAQDFERAVQALEAKRAK